MRWIADNVRRRLKAAGLPGLLLSGAALVVISNGEDLKPVAAVDAQWLSPRG